MFIRYVELIGQDDPLLVSCSLRHYNMVNNSFLWVIFIDWISGKRNFNLISWNFVTFFQLREVELIRLCLKHFRQQGYDMAFKALQQQTNVELEYSTMSNLHTALVVHGDFQKTENFIEKCVNGN